MPPAITEPNPSSVPHFAVVIAGAGFAGLCMGVKLREAGIEDFAILEKAAELGGTWRDNDYPGAACDVPGSLYSFSFMQEGGWTRQYPKRDELFAYTRRVAERFDLRRHVRPCTELLSGRFDETRHRWELHTSAGPMTATALVSAVGPLSRPALPELPGLVRFQGRVFHSSRWDHAHDLAGQRVAVIGTGASAIQFIPEIAKSVAALHIFQRSAPWVVPRGDRLTSLARRQWLSRSPVARQLSRFIAFLTHEVRLIAFAKHPALMRLAQRRLVRHIRAQVPEALWPAVTPTDVLGCKRILISDDYYPALRQPHVELIPEAVASFTEDAVTTRSGQRRQIDVAIFATGFDADKLVGSLELTGVGGQSLQRRAQAGLEAYKGVTLHGFPNFFVLGGPNTGLGHTSILLMIEASASYTTAALVAMRQKGLRSVDVEQAASDRYNDWLQALLARSVWRSGCTSWYLHGHSGKNHVLWPTFTTTYRRITRTFDLSNYRTA